jgi:hypothetical protein
MKEGKTSYEYSIFKENIFGISSKATNEADFYFPFISW